MKMARGFRLIGGGIVVAGLLAGCGWFDDEEILEGERIRIRDRVVDARAFTGPVPALPQAVRNTEWTQTNATSTHAAGHLAGPAALSLAWTVDAGAGDDDGITSAPVIANGRVFTLDAAAQVSAFDASSGTLAWRSDLAPEGEDGDDGFGGGLAILGETVLATTGFGEIVALSAASGDVLWRYRAGAPFRAAPAAAGGVVIAVTRDNRAVAVDATTGQLGWRLDGITSDAGLLGGASPAISGRLAVLPFASGEIIGVDATSGRSIWNAVLGGARRGLARASISDVTGDPVIVGRAVIAANQSGRIVAIDGQTGRRGWTRSVGSTGPLWTDGTSIYLTADDAALMRLSAQTGQTIWRNELAAFEDPEDREDPIAYSGPVLVGGRLLVTDSLGNLISFDPASGAEVARVSIGSGTTAGVAVANATVYVLSDSGNLWAFR
ncbi:MAG: PQQ-binding-like beta-propeller repeat protein [Pseudomonadota bacterium]